MTHGEEELLVAYFQTYMKKMKGSFAQGAKILGASGKGDMGQAFRNASENIHDFVKLEKPTPQGYRFMVKESILKATDIPLPAHIKRMIYGGSEGIWSRLKNRICNDLHGQLARRMGFKASEIQVLSV